MFDGNAPKAVGINGLYLREMVDALTDEGATVTMQVTGEVDPVRVDSTLSATAVVMPRRL